jgi:hypothetical protein
MRFDSFSFGLIQIDGYAYEHDVIIDHGEIRKRKKKPSKKIPRAVRPHAALDRRGDPLEMLPTCHRQWCVRSIARDPGCTAQAEHQKTKLLVLPTIEAIEVLKREPKGTIGLLHVTC